MHLLFLFTAVGLSTCFAQVNLPTNESTFIHYAGLTPDEPSPHAYGKPAGIGIQNPERGVMGNDFYENISQSQTLPDGMFPKPWFYCTSKPT